MPIFSGKSLTQLKTCEQDLQTLFNEVIKYFDCTVTEGFRDQLDQDKAFAEGKSKLKFPYGNHNSYPSKAVDVYPYPVDMKDTMRFYFFAGFVKGLAAQLKAEGKISHSIRWGGDWDSDNDFEDNKFNDLVHFELTK